MKRAIITIDDAKCDGCGLCVGSCAEGALAVIDGKARLVSEVYCDGLGACLGECPQGAITIEEREAPAFDQAEVDRHLAKAPGGDCQCHGHQAAEAPHHAHGGGGCPGATLRQMTPPTPGPTGEAGPSQLRTWPVQLRLVPPSAPWLRGAHLLVCADCVPFAVPDFHQRWLAGRVVVVACPKLDDQQANVEKLTAIFQTARPASVTVLRMEVPCCGGLAQATRIAALQSGTAIPVEVVTMAIDGSGVV